MSTVLITGIAGGMAIGTAQRLLREGHRVVGVDYRSLDRARALLPDADLHRAAYNKTAIEDVFRKARPEAVLHLGRVGNLAEDLQKRFELNVIGSQKLMNLCLDHGVRSLVVLSTFHIYGASPRNPTPISEEDPVRAGTDFPELADAIQLDNMAFTWAYRFPKVRTVVLRATNIIGPSLHNTMSRVLRLPAVPYMMGFDPMTQFVHQDDMSDAVIAALRGAHPGVYNVAGPAAIPWRTALRVCGKTPWPWMSSFTKLMLRVASPLPAYLVNFLKHSCVITDAAFRRDFGWAPTLGIEETLRSTVRGQA